MAVNSSGAKVSQHVELPGLDVLRVVALALVVAQHGMSVYNVSEFTDWGSWSIGQVGVSIFLAISGYLAARSNLPPVAWLCRRLARIFPAFWIAMLISFGLTMAFGYKSFGLGQFISQMLGIGLFTHPEGMVNVASWFISLLLLCYGIAFVARASRAEALVCTIVLFASLWQGHLIATNLLLPAHVISFTGAYAMSRYGSPPWLAWVVAIVLGLATTANSCLLYPAISLGSFGVIGRLGHSKIIVSIVKYSYEYYLIHGIFIVGVSRYITTIPPALAFICALLMSSGAAVLLNFTVEVLTRSRPVKKRSPDTSQQPILLIAADET